jgi:predicted small lipoprotein YifL
LYGAAVFGDIAVNRTASYASSRWAALVLIAVTLMLTGCGRKGGLDLPPNVPVQPTAAAEGNAEADAAANKGTLFNPSFGMDRPPAATAGRKRDFVLDPLLND